MADITVREALSRAWDRLTAADIEYAELEAEVLLRHAMAAGAAMSRSRLYTRLGDRIDDEVLDSYEALISRRLDHEPSAYIVGHREFYGLDLEVSPDVLIPRPETELLVELVTGLRAATGRSAIVDAGTGSGAIAIALATNLPEAHLIGTDISEAALAIARQNARSHQVETQVIFLEGDLLGPVEGPVDVIVANLPYVTTAAWHVLDPEVRDYEPRLALDGGGDGLDLIREFLRQAPGYLRAGGAIALEFGIGQADTIRDLAGEAFPGASITVHEDFSGIPRVLTIET